MTKMISIPIQYFTPETLAILKKNMPPGSGYRALHGDRIAFDHAISKVKAATTDGKIDMKKVIG